jgi:WD40 repeat protein
LAWSPDNIHLASCGTDAQICIWNVNIKVLDAKANGLAFDPFGKFLASQSSEGKDLIIWRVQDFKNIT